jgi:hypothetical protein
MNRRIVVAGLVALSAGMAIWGGWEHSQRTRLARQVVALTSERDELARARPAPGTLAEESANRADGSKKPPSPLAAGPSGSVAAPGDSENSMKGFAKMLSDPAMKDMIKANSRMQIESMYRDVFDLLELDENQRANLEKILADRTNAQFEIGMSFMNGGAMTDAERKAKGEEMKKAMTESEERLKAELGEEKFAMFKRYEESQGERMQLKTFSGMLREQSLELSEAAESELMTAMFEERKNFKFDNDLGRPDQTDFSKFNDASISRFTEQSAELRGKILSRARNILTSDQIEVFQKAQDQQANMEQMGLRMARSMIGGK